MQMVVFALPASQPYDKNQEGHTQEESKGYKLVFEDAGQTVLCGKAYEVCWNFMYGSVCACTYIYSSHCVSRLTLAYENQSSVWHNCYCDLNN